MPERGRPERNVSTDPEFKRFALHFTVPLLLALAVVTAVGWPAPLPASMWAVALGTWILMGWKARRPRLMMAITVVIITAVGSIGFQQPLLIAILFPLWIGLVEGNALARSRGLPHPRPLRLTEGLADAWVRFDQRQPAWLRSPRLREAVRRSLAGAAGAFVFHHYFHSGIVGSNDAVWYASTTIDHILQWRAQLEPVFVGQTEYAALGNVVPLRVAPYFQHLSLALDFLTLRRFSPVLLQNLAIVVTGGAAGLSAYLCLVAITPKRRVAALLLALLFVFSPAVAALAYTGDLFMSVMTLPYLPIVFAGVVRSFRQRDLTAQFMIAAGCAACWLAHSPIGLWVSLLAFSAQLVRLFMGGQPRLRLLGQNLAGAGVFIVLCGYVFVSVLSLGNSGTHSTPTENVLQCIDLAFPGALLPVSPTASQLGDFQLGYSLWLVLLGCALVTFRHREPLSITMLSFSTLLLCLTLPVPLLTELLWRLMPGFIIDVTNACPMQRLYPIVAAATTAGAAVLLSGQTPRPSRDIWLNAALVLGCVWSIAQLQPFFGRAEYLAMTTERTAERLHPFNLAPTRYAQMMLSERSRYFSHGVIDFELEHRLLTPELDGYVATNVGAILPSHDHAPRRGERPLPHLLTGEIVAGENRVVPLHPAITVPPGGHLLALEFLAPSYAGHFQLIGDGYYREYLLPRSGNELAFGSDGDSSRVIPLHNPSDQTISLAAFFVNANEEMPISQYGQFARWELVPFDREQLPIRLRSLFPYVVEIDAPQPAWLETVRLYTPGWTARVNGQRAAVRASPNDQLMVAVEAGTSRVEFAFEPPLGLVTSYWMTLFGWVALVGAALGRRRFRSL